MQVMIALLGSFGDALQMWPKKGLSLWDPNDNSNRIPYLKSIEWHHITCIIASQALSIYQPAVGVHLMMVNNLELSAIAV